VERIDISFIRINHLKCWLRNAIISRIISYPPPELIIKILLRSSSPIEKGFLKKSDRDLLTEEVARLIRTLPEYEFRALARHIRIYKPAGSLRAFIERLGVKDRADYLSAYYKKRPSWESFRSQHPTHAEMRSFLETAFPNYEDAGLLLGDLKRLDGQAYTRIMNWKIDSRAEFNLPGKKSQANPPIIPTANEVQRAIRAGDPEAWRMKRVHQRARNREPS
jgi:hypothetical protein